MPVIVHRQAVRHAPVVGEADQDPAVADRSGRGVVLVCADLQPGGVDEVHRAPIGTPPDPVRDRESREARRDGEVRIDRQQGARPRRGIQRHPLDPEAARRVALAVVAAEAALVRIEPEDRLQRPAVGVERREAVGERCEECPVAAERDRPDRRSDVHCPVVARARIESADLPRGDVHPPEDAPDLVPDRPLAERRAGIRHELEGRLPVGHCQGRCLHRFGVVRHAGPRG